MQAHTKVYLSFLGLGSTASDGDVPVIRCEMPRCQNFITDIHHISGRGKDGDVIENLCGLCRNCHQLAHAHKLSKERIEQAHKAWMERVIKARQLSFGI